MCCVSVLMRVILYRFVGIWSSCHLFCYFLFSRYSVICRVLCLVACIA